MHELVTSGVIGFIIGGGVCGYAGYWLANHHAQTRIDVANLAGQLQSQASTFLKDLEARVKDAVDQALKKVP